ncbi:MAG: hypothetical protein CSA76_01520 [Spirochaetales bacterium]|nr:MAG: hypothetical protein CSA76_01520 [Spirochaetales bacterium]
MMKTTQHLKRLYLLSVTAFLLILAGCTGLGIYAQIAVSEKIISGYLPQGISPGKVCHITGANVDNYDFFSSNTGLWVRNITDRDSVTESTKWKRVSLNGWNAVQSMDATDNHIILTMVRVSGDTHEVGLFYFGSANFNPATLSVDFQQISGTNWTNPSHYYVARVFVPRSASDDVYVNVLRTNKPFGEPEVDFVDSSLYHFSTITSGALPAALAGNWPAALTSPVRYVDSAASDGTATLFSIIKDSNSTSGSSIVNSSGNAVTAAQVQVPVTGLTYMTGLGTGSGCFIGGGTAADSTGVYPVYATHSLSADNWVKINGSSSDFQLGTFLDVSTTTAGSGKVLAGSHSLSSNSTNTPGIGYAEINVPGGSDPAAWTISSSNLTFAYSNNFLVSELHEASIQAMAMHDGYVYASTRGKGLWHINSAVNSPSWIQE